MICLVFGDLEKGQGSYSRVFPLTPLSGVCLGKSVYILFDYRRIATDVVDFY